MFIKRILGTHEHMNIILHIYTVIVINNQQWYNHHKLLELF